MKIQITKIVCCIIFSMLITTKSIAQLSPINFETGGYGATWTWTTFENATNLPTQIVANPNASGINTSANVIKMTTLVAGNPWAGFESLHGAGIGTFSLNTTNCIVKLMVYKSVISDVGVKFATAAGASTGEIKVPNTKINQWEELTFDFSAQIGQASNINIDQIIIFPDFNARTTDNDCYIDNITLGAGVPVQNINVKFAVQNPDSIPVYVFGNWNNWNNFPGTPMVYNSAAARYEATLPFNAGTTIEYLFVNGIGTKEVLNATWACTNANSQYTNRLSVLGNTDTTLCNSWQSCNGCAATTINKNLIKAISYKITNNYLLFENIPNGYIDNIEIVNINGEKLYSSNKKIKSGEAININLKNNALYIIKYRNEGLFYSFKTIINNF